MKSNLNSNLLQEIRHRQKILNVELRYLQLLMES